MGETLAKGADRAKVSMPDPQAPESLQPEYYRVPRQLSVNPTQLKSVLIVGSCLAQSWRNELRAMAPSCEADLYLGTAPLPDLPNQPIDRYQLQVVQLPLRPCIPDSAFARLDQNDLAAHEDLFRFAMERLRLSLARSMRWNREHGLLTFVVSFPVPQQNLIGRLLPRYDLRNPVHFVEKLNESLAECLRDYQNAYFFDFNAVASTHGKRFSSEDHVSAFNHGSVIGDFDFGYDRERLDPVQRLSAVFSPQVGPLLRACWREITAMYASVQQTDVVKMVVVDLDDTLWRGTVADTDIRAMPTREGWPLAFWEALLVLKRRGILLGIISKNEETRVREAWPVLLGKAGPSLDDFAVRRINWAPKSQNMAEILAAVNILPGNVVYIDDSPLQRAEIRDAFPTIRTLGGTPSLWRHVLLWAPETQLSAITDESVHRTRMMQAQIARETVRQSRSPEEFLASLDIAMTIFPLADSTHPRFPRVIELINKTNQFNTTGRRWSLEECNLAFAGGAEFLAFELSDRFTDYGLVGVLIVDAAGIRQFVMSCRIMGLEAECAAVAHVMQVLRGRGHRRMIGAMLHTDRNLPCRDLYHRCGFTPCEGGWERDLAAEPLAIPAHIRLTAG